MSPKYTLNKEDGLKILRGTVYAVGGALVTYLLSILPNIDFGQYTLVIVPIVSVLLNAGVKYFKGE
ncbi:MAG: hypothetical protein WCI80_05430 [Bacteroidota bacterium]